LCASLQVVDIVLKFTIDPIDPNCVTIDPNYKNFEERYLRENFEKKENIKS